MKKNIYAKLVKLRKNRRCGKVVCKSNAMIQCQCWRLSQETRQCVSEKGEPIVPHFKQGSTILLQGEDFGAISKEFGAVRCNLGGDNVEICDLSTADVMDDLFQAVGESFVVLLGQAFRSSSQTH